MSIPSIWQSGAALLAVFGIWFIMKKLTPWLQAYRNRQKQTDMERARTQAQRENQQANSDSDAADQREREHDGG